MGDLDAFEALVRATSTECFSLAVRLVGNEADAADVVQDAYLRAFRAIGAFREDASVRTWLYRIVANSAATLRRRRPAASVEIGEVDLVERRLDRDPELVAQRNAEREAIVDALGHLPFALRAVVVLRDIYDLSHEAIASELGISRAAAKVRLHRARKILRVTLDERLERPRLPTRTATVGERRAKPVPRSTTSTHSGSAGASERAGRARAV